jgi:hypothetical protein
MAEPLPVVLVPGLVTSPALSAEIAAGIPGGRA